MKKQDVTNELLNRRKAKCNVVSVGFDNSGIYLYRMEVIGEGNIPVYTEMKKMVLVK